MTTRGARPGPGELLEDLGSGGDPPRGTEGDPSRQVGGPQVSDPHRTCSRCYLIGMADALALVGLAVLALRAHAHIR